MEEFESRSIGGLSRSKSDHRLVSEFRRQEESSPPVRRRAFGESRYNRDANKSRTNLNRYGGDDEDEEPTGRSRYRSRFLRGGDDDDDSDRRNSKAMDEDPMTKKERNKVIDTEDASRGPLSGCIRLADSSRVIQRLKEREMELTRPKKKDTPPPAPKPAAAAAPKPAAQPAGEKSVLRQLAEAHKNKDDDEIDRIKRENREAQQKAPAATTTTPTPAPAPAPALAPAAAPAPTIPEPAPVPARRTTTTP